MTTRLAGLALLALAACAADESRGLSPDEQPIPSAPGKSDGFCPAVAANMTTTIAPPYACHPLPASDSR